MPSIVNTNNSIKSNIIADLALNYSQKSGTSLAQSQLRLSTGKRINQATDDISGFITSNTLIARNSELKSALRSSDEALNVVAIAQNSYENISNLLTEIKSSAATASSSSLGTDEIVALGKASYRLAQQIQLVVDSTAFSGRQLLYGNFSAQFTVGSSANNNTLKLNVNLSYNNTDLNVESGNFKLFSTKNNLDSSGISNFGGISNLDLSLLNSISNNELGIFANSVIGDTISSLADALKNISNVAAYLGGIQNRLQSQNEIINSQMVNYSSAISRIQDTNVADEQLNYSKSAFLQSSSLSSLSQANLSPFNLFRLFTN